jgi:hypothetical protein
MSTRSRLSVAVAVKEPSSPGRYWPGGEKLVSSGRARSTRTRRVTVVPRFSARSKGVSV